ncbi:peptidyl-prolyl cis-trans isomerase C [Paucibacter oligotrophus]|uniref:peptidylprolyl isomerase n=1 Tax=Roseateles oligotrophus TaxID=1769250 RepID=A0A840LD50_9BURK|nr:peptidylprolyl isomerase [Roseateles oligotrophus]MBB4845641.1 peptidyl-prolyl cis-trans isomerase C [Roseateles oligotrophus]
MTQEQSGCGGGKQGGCGCQSQAAAPAKISAQINGVPLHGPDEVLGIESLRQRAYSELLRQAAQRAGLLAVGDLPALDGVLSEAASQAIEQLLEREIQIPQADKAACLRHYQAHAARYAQGERVQAQHILFAVTEGLDIAALRQRAEGLLVSLRCGDEAAFAQAAAEFSNCPSGAQGGQLGWLTRADCAPEFAAALFAQDEANAHIGVLPRLISTRFGFHIVRVQQRQPGQAQPFEAVRAAIAQTLGQQAYVTALRQYLNLLVGAAMIEGLQLEGADSPLLQ